MSGADIQILLDAVNENGRKVEDLTAAISLQGNRITALEVEMKMMVRSKISASRLVWGAGEIMILICMIVLPAVGAYFGTKWQLDYVTSGFAHHVEQAKVAHPEFDGWDYAGK
jgi:hypothetical protein